MRNGIRGSIVREKDNTLDFDGAQFCEPTVTGFGLQERGYSVPKILVFLCVCGTIARGVWSTSFCYIASSYGFV